MSWLGDRLSDAFFLIVMGLALGIDWFVRAGVAIIAVLALIVFMITWIAVKLVGRRHG